MEKMDDNYMLDAIHPEPEIYARKQYVINTLHNFFKMRNLPQRRSRGGLNVQYRADAIKWMHCLNIFSIVSI